MGAPLPVSLSSAGRRRAERLASRSEAGRRVVADILEQVARITGFEAETIAAPCRRAALVEARDLVVYEAHLRGVSLHVIAGALGRDWSTVRAALRREAARRQGLSR